MTQSAFFVVGASSPMSLKAKVEAVVYAAEEPVTLAQLAGIFSSEVLEELEAAAGPPPEEAQPSREGEAAPHSPSNGMAASSETAEFFAQEPEAQVLAQVSMDEVQAPAIQGSESPAAEKIPEEIAGQGDDKKKAVRQRDRQVREALQKILDQLIAEYAEGERGMEIREIAGGYRMATKPEYHDAVRGFVKSMKPPMKLSLQALETLAVIAYKQPVTAPEVSEIRGVDSGGVLGSLLSRKLITTAGRKHVIGRPILYKTTKEFLLRFGLKDLNELPSMEEFEKMAGELAQAEAEAEDAAMRSSDAPLMSQEVVAEQSEETQSSAGQVVLVDTAVVTEEVVPRSGQHLEETAAHWSPEETPLTSLGIAPSPLPSEAPSQSPSASEDEISPERGQGEHDEQARSSSRGEPEPSPDEKRE